jgi:hypothetical protein
MENSSQQINPAENGKSVKKAVRYELAEWKTLYA